MLLIQPSDKFEVLEEVIKLKSKTPTGTTQQKIIKITHNGTDEKLWKMLNKLKKETADNKNITKHHVNAMSPERLIKMTSASPTTQNLGSLFIQ